MTVIRKDSKNAVLSIYPLFPNIVHCIEIKDFGKIQDELIDFVYNEENENPVGQLYSNKGGWQSNPFYHQSDNILFSLLYKHVGDYFSDTDFFRENLKYGYSGLWLNINKNGDYNSWHCHPNAELAGVMWIQVPTEGDSGRIKFTSPHEFIESKSFRMYNSNVDSEHLLPDCAYAFKPTAGTILIFPAHLYHEVEPNQTRSDRISASFNINLLP